MLTWNRLNSWRVQRTSPSFVMRLFFIKHRRTDFLFRKCFRCGSCKGLYSPGLYSVKKGSDKSKSIVIPGTSWNDNKVINFAKVLTLNKISMYWIKEYVNANNLFPGSCSVVTSLCMTMNCRRWQGGIFVFNVVGVINRWPRLHKWLKSKHKRVNEIKIWSKLC